MIHLMNDELQRKGWLVGPWNSTVPVPIGYATAGVDEKHYHAQMYEIYLIAQGKSTIALNGQEVTLEAGQVFIVEPGEVHTFSHSTDDYLHFVIQVPFVTGDKHLV